MAPPSAVVEAIAESGNHIFATARPTIFDPEIAVTMPRPPAAICVFLVAGTLF